MSKTQEQITKAKKMVSIGIPDYLAKCEADQIKAAERDHQADILKLKFAGHEIRDMGGDLVGNAPGIFYIGAKIQVDAVEGILFYEGETAPEEFKDIGIPMESTPDASFVDSTRSPEMHKVYEHQANLEELQELAVEIGMTGEVIMPSTNCWYCKAVDSLDTTETSSMNGGYFVHQKCQKCNMKTKARVVVN